MQFYVSQVIAILCISLFWLQGCTLTINDKEILIKGAVLAMLADTQAAHAIGGFKVGVGFSLRKCRNCLATKETMSAWVSTFYVTAFLLGFVYQIKQNCSKAVFERDKTRYHLCLRSTCVAKCVGYLFSLHNVIYTYVRKYLHF